MPFLASQQVISVKLQAGQGTYESPIDTDSVLCENLQFSFVEQKSVERNSIRVGTLGKLGACNVTRMAQLSFDTEVKGSGAAGVASEDYTLNLIAGFAATIVAATSVTYSLNANPVYLASVAFRYGDQITEMYDCTATSTVTIKANMTAIKSWVVTGRLNTMGGTSPFVPLYDAVKPAQCNAMNMQYAGVGFSATSLAIDLQVQNSPVESLNGSDGFEPPYITGRGPIKISIDPLIGGVVWNSFWSDNTANALTIDAVGSGAGNSWQIVIPAVKILDVQHADRNEYKAYSVEMEAVETTLNDEISVIYT